MINKFEKNNYILEKVIEEKCLYRENMICFLCAIKEAIDKNYDATIYNDIIDVELNMIRNSLTWQYDYEYFGKNRFENRERKDTFFFDIFNEYETKNEILSENQSKNFFCDVWKPERLLESVINKDFSIDFKPLYLRNLELGMIYEKGNHALFYALAKKRDFKITVRMIDDTNFLKGVTTDGEYFYIGNKRRYVINPKFAMLIMLTKLKMGFVSFDELYEEIKHLSVYDGIYCIRDFTVDKKKIHFKAPFNIDVTDTLDGVRGVEDFFEIDCMAKDLNGLKIELEFKFQELYCKYVLVNPNDLNNREKRIRDRLLFLIKDK